MPVFSSVLQIAHTERQHSFPVGADQRIGIFAVLLHADPCVGKAEARSHVELTGDYLLPAAVDIAVGQFPARNDLAHYGPVAQELLGTVKVARHDLSPRLVDEPPFDIVFSLNADRGQPVLREIPGVVELHRNNDSAIRGDIPELPAEFVRIPERNPRHVFLLDIGTDTHAGEPAGKIAAIVVTEAADIAQRIGEQEFPFGGRAGAGHTDPVTDTAQALPLQRHDHTPRAVDQAVEHPAIPGFPPDHGMAVAEIRGIVVGRRHHHLPEGIGIPVFPVGFHTRIGNTVPALIDPYESVGRRPHHIVFRIEPPRHLRAFYPNIDPTLELALAAIRAAGCETK